MVAALKAQLFETNINVIDQLDITRSELDSHSNMVFVGKDYFVFESTGKTCNVKPFTTDLGVTTNMLIVNTALAYNCPF